MPHFTLTLSAQGPFVDAFVFPSEARRKALADANQPIPKPFQIRALLDTGASCTCVDPSVMESLEIPPTGSSTMNTPSTGSTPHEVALYDVMLAIPGSVNGQALVRTTLGVAACHLLKSQGFHALIGRDVLAGCVLTYNGTAQYFTLAY